MMHDLTLVGLDGSSPLAFLAAVGTLQTLSDAWPDRKVRMGWRFSSGWRPFLRVSSKPAADDVVVALDVRLKGPGVLRPFEVHDDLKLTPPVFRQWAREAAFAADVTDRRWCDFVAAFGCEAVVNDGFVADTAFRTMSGAGHQHFLATMRELVITTTAEHIRKTLFDAWRYDDPLEKRTMRWDPIDDRRYALRWDDPASDRTKSKQGSQQGANRLAIEGLRLFPTGPMNGGVATLGFTGRRSADTYFTWPLWTAALEIDVIRSVLARSDVQEANVRSGQLRACGVDAVFRSRRLTVGKFRSFAPAEAIL